mmetsp:Transcript_22394/g.62101  ORF Transcript_22394/g.62101 Transcript_22394/m.62101 type:complete len:181 (-) Transcript_22394:181-723(-)|eukprot:CAMPEP_0117668784 /NCGR_PEP_ID=MMETSP0804-20121206/11751_1 /TAXON_ID=1074897 /ORGANISM="Tetraselmis astigmatica, Strain CCMP880" /LENGTH=180 /DNA_ID=CAMNT_0005476733 /DNA_START=317 /DNA_END=859 /DNA_ORIENTATION=+
MAGLVLVTVGSTLFEALIKAVDSLGLADELVRRGYSTLVIQIGSGTHLPISLLPNGSNSGVLRNGLAVEWFRFAPSLDKYMARASLVISHAGSASTFESLRAGRKLVAVPNPVLMNNHQMELAKELASQGFCIFSTAEGLLDTLQTMDLASLKPFEHGNPRDVAAAIDSVMNRAVPTKDD